VIRSRLPVLSRTASKTGGRDEVSDELVFTVAGATASPAQPVSLEEAGLRERSHLQEWVIAHPQILGPDVRVIAFEFGRWIGLSGSKERDRLDVLGLDTSGQLVIAELKRGMAPDTVEMQGLKYAAMASRFTIDRLAALHAQFLAAQRGSTVTPEEALAELQAHATLLDDSTLRQPRVVLLAADFSKVVSSTVVFLRELGLDMRLVRFQAYRTEAGIIITVSQHYPVPEVEEFTLMPELVEQREERADRQQRQRDTSAVRRLIAANAVLPGTRFRLRPAWGPGEEARAAVEQWAAADPRRAQATWQESTTAPLVWDYDGASYSPTGLARHILREATGDDTHLQGTLWWADEQGRDLVTLAAELPSDAPTVEDITALAEANGIGEPFRLLLDAGQRHGLPLRPYRAKVMVTAPTNRNRMLYTLDTQPRDGRLHLYISPDAFTEALVAPPDDAPKILGADEERWLTPVEVQQLVLRLDQLLSR
jgi:hypothetical protein